MVTETSTRCPPREWECVRQGESNPSTPSSLLAARMALSAWAGVGVLTPLPRALPIISRRPEVTGNKVKRGREVHIPDDLVECLEDLVF